jgi:hypothetical protein
MISIFTLRIKLIANPIRIKDEFDEEHSWYQYEYRMFVEKKNLHQKNMLSVKKIRTFRWYLFMVKKNKKMLSPPLRRKRWFQFSHWEFSIHPAQSTYGVYISQLICYSIACGSYHEFIERGYSHQGCCWTNGSWCLCWSHHFETFKVHDLINRYGCHKWPRICSVCCNHNVFLSSFMTYHSVCNTTCANNVTGTVPFRSHKP